MTAEIIGEQAFQDPGGRRIAVKVTWEPGDTPWARNAVVKVRVVRRTGPGPSDFAEVTRDGVTVDLHSGDAGTRHATYGNLIAPEPTDNPASTVYLRYLNCRSPRLACGTYWLKIMVWNGASWDETYVDSAFRILPRLRHEEVLTIRRRFPPPRWNPGATEDAQEPIIRA